MAELPPPDGFPPAAGFDLVDVAGVEVGVDRHLLAGHGIEGEPGGDLRHAAGAIGDDDELDDDEDQEEDDAHHEVAADHELAEALDHTPGRARSFGAVQQDQSCRRHVEGEPVERRHQPISMDAGMPVEAAEKNRMQRSWVLQISGAGENMIKSVGI